MGIQHDGYNIYALGPAGVGKHTLVEDYLAKGLKERPEPSDWCYVNNFEEPSKPRILNLPKGKGGIFALDMERFVQEIQNGLKGAFESEEYQNRLQATEQEFKEQQHKVFEDLQQKASEKNLTLVRTPTGFAFAPLREGEPLPPEEFQKLPEEERKQIESDIQEMQNKSQRVFQKFPAWQRELRKKVSELNQEVAQYVIEPMIREIKEKYKDIPQLEDYLNAVENDIIQNAQALLTSEKSHEEEQTHQSLSFGAGHQLGSTGESGQIMRKYKVNVLVNNAQTHGAPVVYEDNPTYARLVGRVEHQAMMGALITDFNLIKQGALHRANGGALILDAYKVLTQPGAWDGLKRALISREIRIESLAEMFSLVSTTSLEPEPVALDVKVVLVGNPMIYYLLKDLDPEFPKLFKVAADFDVQMDWSDDNQEFFAHLLTGIIEQNTLKSFDRSAVGRVIEYTARRIGDQKKLSTNIQGLSDLLREADYWAGHEGNDVVSAQDVQTAIDAFVYRSGLIREHVQEAIHRNTLFIDTQGTHIGQVNGLSVLMLGDFMFGRPNRITARIRMGKGEVVDIEREAKLSGPLHSKGVLILSGFLGARYACDRPLSLSASLVFEQSYGGIEGDSASSAELYCLISAIAEVPLKQAIAVTGSVNQHGYVQPIGGVNEKIEGFFDICHKRGLTSEQGVLIPEANVQHLMLRQDVIEAVAAGQFHIYPVATIDEGLEILTDLPAGEPDTQEIYPAETINGMVQMRLTDLAEKREQFAKGEKEGGTL
jgi:lon-related putative ATP-dependent protease